jgi:hypothetical protein
MKEIATKVAKLEGKKTQARIGEIREILSILSDIMWEDEYHVVFDTIYKNGKRRAKKK